MSSQPLLHGDPIIIVGAGVFGLSAALELAQRGFRNVTILDRMLPPVSDGSSVDFNRIIRPDYADPFYARLAREALDVWKSSELYKPFYHQTGFVLTSDRETNDYVDGSKAILKAQGAPFTTFRDTAELRRIQPVLRDIQSPVTGYFNPNAGWANAAGAIQALARHCSHLGVSFVSGPRGTFTSLKLEGNPPRVVGVNVASGAPQLACKVILATGAWTTRYMDIDHAITSSGQPVGFIQLTTEEAQELRDLPIVMNMSTGVFIFPPLPGSHLLKIARHSHGFEVNSTVSDHAGQKREFSAPKIGNNNAGETALPAEAEQALREGLRQLVPRVAEKPWVRQRLCWYTETPTGDFIVDNHPSIGGLFIVGGGSGHAFKFLPVLGRYVVDCLEGKASQEVSGRWRLREKNGAQGPIVCKDGSRGGPLRRRLNGAEIAKL